MDDNFCDFLEQSEFGETSFAGDDLFAILESLDGITDVPLVTPLDETAPEVGRLTSQKSSTTTTTSPCPFAGNSETPTTMAPEPDGTSPKSKRQKTSSPAVAEEANPDGQQRISHITVERNRRKQMNEHLSVLRSLMPCFYVKRGDQASIIGGVVDYINELQQILQSLEAKKQRKVYSDVLSPRLVSSPRPSTLSPRKPPLSPRLNLPPISPRTPTPGSPYKPWPPQQAAVYGGHSPSPTSSSTSSTVDNANELVANSKSAFAEVEVKFCGANVVLKTVSPRIPGQVVKIIAALEELALEILQVNVSTVDETLLNSFTIKIGIECQLSAEELANQVQQTFCQLPSS